MDSMHYTRASLRLEFQLETQSITLLPPSSCSCGFMRDGEKHCMRCSASHHPLKPPASSQPRLSTHVCCCLAFGWFHFRVFLVVCVWANATSRLLAGIVIMTTGPELDCPPDSANRAQVSGLYASAQAKPASMAVHCRCRPGMHSCMCAGCTALGQAGHWL